MTYTVYEYTIKDGKNTYTGSFTLKENPKHPEIVEELKAHKVNEFKA